MPSYKLTYFNGRGRGEISRMLFAAAAKPFEDVRIESADWPKVKENMPQGTMPVLEVDGKMKISQSTSVARFLAREFNLYGKGNQQMAIIDQIVDTCIDIFGTFVSAVFNPDETKKAELLKKVETVDVPKFLGFLEDLVKLMGKSGFAVGDSLTLADLMLYVYIENMKMQEKLDKFPRLAVNRKKIAELPRIKKYLSNRPETPF